MSDYEGYTGVIAVEDDWLILTHRGLAARAAGLVVDQPRRIPLAAVSGVSFKDASRLTNGWLALGLGGAEGPQLSAGSAASNPNTVMFRHNDKERFATLHQWLLSVVAINRERGIDSTQVAYDEAHDRLNRAQNHLDAIQTDGQSRRKAARAAASAKAEERTHAKKAAAIEAGQRPDIATAAARMGWKMGGRRELKKLAEHLHADETVRFIAQGAYDDKQGIVVLTDLRLLFLFHGLMSQAKEDFPLRLISSVSTKSGFATGQMRVFVAGNTANITSILKTDLEPLADAVRLGMASQPSASPPNVATKSAPATAPAPPATPTDPYEALRKLADLHDAGVLSDDEFAAKKQELLDRL